jgi:glycosyltransferase involved in cell wall biosynthesis
LAGFRQIEEIPVYYGLAKAFIHPALQDQWGVVVNEAMASGLPVIVSKNCGCAPELVEQGGNGFVFDPLDVAQLADYMLRISSDPVSLEQMGRASLEKISHWGLDRFAEGLYSAAEIALED